MGGTGFGRVWMSTLGGGLSGGGAVGASRGALLDGFGGGPLALPESRYKRPVS